MDGAVAKLAEWESNESENPPTVGGGVIDDIDAHHTQPEITKFLATNFGVHPNVDTGVITAVNPLQSDVSQGKVHCDTVSPIPHVGYGHVPVKTTILSKLTS